jgi:hypothetical protein
MTSLCCARKALPRSAVCGKMLAELARAGVDGSKNAALK